MGDDPEEHKQTNINAEVTVGEQQGGSASGVGIEKFQSGVTNIYSNAGIWVLGAISVIAVAGLLWIAISLLNREKEPAVPVSAGTTEPALVVSGSSTTPSATATDEPREPTPFLTASSTAEITNTPTELPEPTGTNVPDLAAGCINRDIWTPYQGEAHPVDTLGCWDLQDWGIQGKDNGMLIRSAGTGAGELHGIYRLLNPYSRIDFDVNISRMGTVGDLEPKLMFGVLPSTLRSKDAGKYLSYQRESITQDFLYIKINDGTLNRGQYLPLRYNFAERQQVTLLVRGNEFSLYINGDQVGDPVRMTYKVTYFWIGYDLPPGTSLDAEVTDVIVVDQ